MTMGKSLTGNFLVDVAGGQVAEREAQAMILDVYRDAEIVQGDNDTPEFDFIARIRGREVSFEVKEDFRAADTGNVAVEVRTRGKLTGIFKIKADFVVYKVHCPDGRKVFVQWNTKALRQKILTGDYIARVNGAGRDDAQQCVLFAVDDFIGHGFELGEIAA